MKTYTHEIRRKSNNRKFYLSELGHDMLELVTLNRLKFTAKVFSLHCAVIYMTEEQLVKDAINALLGVPSKAFFYQDDESVILLHRMI